MRAIFDPCGPSGYAQPQITSSMSAGSSCVRSSSPLTTCAARVSGLIAASGPLRAKVCGERA